MSELEKAKEEFWEKLKGRIVDIALTHIGVDKLVQEMQPDLDKIIEEAVSHYCNKFKERYPEDVFPPDGNSLDCKSARMARLTCDNIIEEAKKEERDGTM